MEYICADCLFESDRFDKASKHEKQTGHVVHIVSRLVKG